MFGSDRMFTRDGQTRQDANGLEWIVLFDIGKDDGEGFYCMGVLATDELPCPVQCVKVNMTDEEKASWSRMEDARKAAEARKQEGP